MTLGKEGKMCPSCGEPLDSHGIGDKAACLEDLAE